MTAVADGGLIQAALGGWGGSGMPLTNRSGWVAWIHVPGSDRSSITSRRINKLERPTGSM